MAGALPEAELFAYMDLFGLVEARITERFDCFEGTSVEHHVARHLEVQGVNFFARRPG